MRLIMRLTKKLVNIWILLVVSTFPPSASGKAITCTAGDFAAGTNASFVCYFPDDIDNHDSVYIQRYPLNAPTNASGSQVLLCKVAEVKASTCKGKDGYVFKGYTRNTILVEVVSVTEEAAGRYVCQFVPPSQSPTDMCNLTVHGAVTPSNFDDHHSSTSDEKQVATMNPETGETGKVSVEVVVSVVILIAIAIAAISIIVGIIMHRRRQRSTESSAPAKTPEKATDESVNPPAAGPNDPLLPTHATSVTSPAARQDCSTLRLSDTPDTSFTPSTTRQYCSTLGLSDTPHTSFTPSTTRPVPKPAFETQPSVESYMKSLAEVDVGKSSVTQSSQIIRTAAPPPVQDDCEGIGGAYTTEQKSPDTDTPKGTYQTFCIEIDNNSDNFEKNKIPSSPETDREEVDSAVFAQLNKLVQIAKKKAEAFEEITRTRASYLGTSSDSQTSKEILRTLLRKLRESGARLQRQAESRQEPVNVQPVISCVEQILDHVERGVDAKTHEAICRIPAEFKELSCKIS